jgi:hypothetical protein
MTPRQGDSRGLRRMRNRSSRKMQLVYREAAVYIPD